MSKYYLVFMKLIVSIIIAFTTNANANNIIGDKNVCLGDEKTYSTSANQVLRWEAVGGDIKGTNCSNSVNVVWNQLNNCSLKLVYHEPDAERCDSTISNISTIMRPSPFIAGSRSTCFNSYETYRINTTNNNLTISWQVDNGMLLSSNDADSIRVFWSNSGIGKIKVIVTNEYGCTDQSELAIQINPSIEPNIFGNAVGCLNQYDYYEAEFLPNSHYEWYATNGHIVGYSNTKDVTVLWDSIGKGSIRLVQTNQNTGCSREFTKLITISDVPKVTLDDFQDICWGAEALQLYGGKPAGGYYTGKYVYDNYIDVIFAGVGEHEILYNVMNANQCVGTAAAKLTIHALPEAPIIKFDNREIFADTEEEVQWYLDDNMLNGAVNKVLKPKFSGTYSAKASNFYGCKSHSSNTIEIDIAKVNEIMNNEICSIINADEQIIINSKVTINSMVVYDLNGSEIFKSETPDTQFTINKAILQKQVYFIMLLTNSGSVETLKFQN